MELMSLAALADDWVYVLSAGQYGGPTYNEKSMSVPMDLLIKNGCQQGERWAHVKTRGCANGEPFPSRRQTIPSTPTFLHESH
jgi:hypothetical protein